MLDLVFFELAGFELVILDPAARELVFLELSSAETSPPREVPADVPVFTRLPEADAVLLFAEPCRLLGSEEAGVLCELSRSARLLPLSELADSEAVRGVFVNVLSKSVSVLPDGISAAVGMLGGSLFGISPFLNAPFPKSAVIVMTAAMPSVEAAAVMRLRLTALSCSTTLLFSNTEAAIS